MYVFGDFKGLLLWVLVCVFTMRMCIFQLLGGEKRHKSEIDRLNHSHSDEQRRIQQRV